MGFLFFGRIGSFDDLLTRPRSAMTFRSRIADDFLKPKNGAEKSMFPVGDHFPRPYDANFSRLANVPPNGKRTPKRINYFFNRPRAKK